MSFEVLTHLRLNKEAGTFEIIEAGYKYEIPNSLYEDFRDYVLKYDLVSSWYKQLSDAELAMVKKVFAYL